MSPKRLHRNYPIRPAPPREASASSQFNVASSVISPQIAVPAKRRGPQTTLACEACRVRKTKCDGRKPCEACRGKSSQCHYDKEGREKNKTSALRSQIADLRVIIKRLSDGSEEEAVEIRRRLKEGLDVSRLAKDLSHTQCQPDITESERSVTPDISNFPVQRLPPIDFLSPSQKVVDMGERWRLPTKLELFKIARQRAMLDAVSADSDEESGELNFTISIPKTYAFTAAFQQIPLVERPNICVHRLFQIEADRAAPPFLLVESPFRANFSSTDISHLVCAWLSYHAFVNPYIHPTAFVTSFAAFESSDPSREILLRSSILTLACFYLPCSDAQLCFEQERAIGFFRSEAEKTWQSQKGKAALSNVQALIAQYECDKMIGRDRVGRQLLNTALDMAQDIGIHSHHNECDAESLEDADAFAAWGIFNFQAIESLIFGKPPHVLRCWTERPTRIIPSQIVDTWHAYRISKEVSNSSFWDHWEALCNLSDIVVDATHLLYGDQIDGFEVPTSVIVAQTQHSRYRLNEWRRNLPDTLDLASNELPHNLWLHMTYYALMIALHRPYTEDSRLLVDESRDVILHSRNIMVESARNIIHLAMISLKRYTQDFSPAHNVQMVATAAFVLVHDMDDSASRADLLSAASILYRYHQRFFLAAALARAVLLVAQNIATIKQKMYPDLDATISESLANGRQMVTESQRFGMGSSMGDTEAFGQCVYSNFPTFFYPDSANPRKTFGRQLRVGEGKLSEVLQALEGRLV